MVIRRFKEFQDMGMEGLAIMEPRVRCTSLEERWKSETVRFYGFMMVGENLGIKREGYVGVVTVMIDERRNEGVEEEDGRVWDGSEDVESIG